MTEPERRREVRQVVQQRGACLLLRTANDIDLAVDRHACRALHVVALGPGLGYCESVSLSRADGREAPIVHNTFLEPGVPHLVTDIERVSTFLLIPEQSARSGRGAVESRNTLSVRVFLADGLHIFLVNLKRGTVGLTEHAFFGVDAVL